MGKSVTSFKSGRSGNPSGNTTERQLAHVVRQISFAEFVNATVDILRMSEPQVQAILDNKESTRSETIIARLISQAAAGDTRSIDLLFDRLFGKAQTSEGMLATSSTHELLIELERRGKIVAETLGQPKLPAKTE